MISIYISQYPHDFIDVNKKRKKKHTDKKGSWESPFLSTADNGERKPMRRNERMQKRHGGDASDRGQIFRTQTVHYHPIIRFRYRIYYFFKGLFSVLVKSVAPTFTSCFLNGLYRNWWQQEIWISGSVDAQSRGTKRDESGFGFG